MQVQADGVGHSARQLMQMNMQLRTSILFGSSSTGQHARVDRRNAAVLRECEAMACMDMDGGMQRVSDELAECLEELEAHHHASIRRVVSP